MDFLQRLSPGQKLKGISSRFYNVLVDVVQDKISADAFMSGGMATPRQLIQIVNSTGSTLDQFSIVGIGDAAVLPVDDEFQFRNEHAFYAATPASGSRFVIIQDTIPDGSIGNGLLFGISKVQISVTDATHIYADPIDSDTAKMASGTHGQAAILWTDDISAAAVGGTILTGSGVPGGGTGSDGDYYKDTLNNQYYGPKSAGVWGAASDYGTGIVWAVVLFGSVGIGNIVSVNSDTTAAQVLNVGTSGTNFAIDDSTPGTHKFNLPDASANAWALDTTPGGSQDVSGADSRGAVNVGDQIFYGNKGCTEDHYADKYVGESLTSSRNWTAGFDQSNPWSPGNAAVTVLNSKSGSVWAASAGLSAIGSVDVDGTTSCVDVVFMVNIAGDAAEYVYDAGFTGTISGLTLPTSSAKTWSPTYKYLSGFTALNNPTYENGFTGTAFGKIWIGGHMTGTGPVVTAAEGGTGRTTLDSGQLLAGAGTSAVDSLSSTRVVGETIELKLGSDSWIAFSEGSF